jgi:hypothetical protein
MQINNTQPASSILSDLGIGPQSPKPSPRQSGGQDKVEISSLASQLSADPSKLSQLQVAYENVTYPRRKSPTAS